MTASTWPSTSSAALTSPMISSNEAVVLERLEVGEPSRGKIVDANHRVADERRTRASHEMRPEEAGRRPCHDVPRLTGARCPCR